MLRLDFEVFASHFGDGTISSSDQEVSVGKRVDTVDSLLEEYLGGADSLEKLPLKRNFDDVAGLGAEVSERIALVNDAGGEDSLDVTHVYV